MSLKTESAPTYDLLAVRPDGLTFLQCVEQAAAMPELLAEYDRLRGTNLSLKGTTLDLMIDEATGRLDAELREFLEFVWDAIFLRCPEITA